MRSRVENRGPSQGLAPGEGKDLPLRSGLFGTAFHPVCLRSHKHEKPRIFFGRPGLVTPRHIPIVGRGSNLRREWGHQVEPEKE